MANTVILDYHYSDAEGDQTRHYLWEPVLKCIRAQGASKIFDVGCGNGAFARHLTELGYQVAGIDPSEQGIHQAKKAAPDLNVAVGSAYQPLVEQYGRFPIVVSLEVVGHLYFPRKFARCVSDLLEPGGCAIISTPYHSYVKNLALAISGKMDEHFTVLWDHGVIKFWSVATLTELFAEVGLARQQVLRVGRIPILAKSMVLVFKKPA